MIIHMYLSNILYTVCFNKKHAMHLRGKHVRAVRLKQLHCFAVYFYSIYIKNLYTITTVFHTRGMHELIVR